MTRYPYRKVCVCAGLLHAGDRIMEVNGFPVDGMEPEQVIQIVVCSLGGGCVKFSFYCFLFAHWSISCL